MKPLARILDDMPRGVRRGTSGDVRALVRMHAECSPATVLHRFLTPHPTLTAQEATRLLVPEGGFSVVADRGETLAGIITVAPGGTATAEVGLWVSDNWQRQGVGTSLLTAAVREAATVSVDELHVTVLPDNGAILPMVNAAGLRARISTRDGITHILVPLRSGRLVSEPQA